MLHDKTHVTYNAAPGKHGRIHRDKYQALNKPMPVCIVIGGDPLTGAPTPMPDSVAR